MVSAAVGLIAAISLIYGVEIDELLQEQIIAGVVALIGYLGAMHGRFTAKEPIKGIFKTPKEPTE